MFRFAGVPIYGHVGTRFDARLAQLVGAQRARRYKETFDKILLRCTKQIQDAVDRSRASTIFVIPDTLYCDVTPYEISDVMRYLLTALRTDRGYTALQVNANSIYIRWSRPMPPMPETPPIEFEDYTTTTTPKRRHIAGGSTGSTAAPPPPVKYVHASAPTRRGGGTTTDVDRLLASLNLT